MPSIKNDYMTKCHYCTAILNKRTSGSETYCIDCAKSRFGYINKIKRSGFRHSTNTQTESVLLEEISEKIQGKKSWTLKES